MSQWWPRKNIHRQCSPHTKNTLVACMYMYYGHGGSISIDGDVAKYPLLKASRGIPLGGTINRHLDINVWTAWQYIDLNANLYPKAAVVYRKKRHTYWYHKCTCEPCNAYYTHTRCMHAAYLGIVPITSTIWSLSYMMST